MFQPEIRGQGHWRFCNCSNPNIYLFCKFSGHHSLAKYCQEKPSKESLLFSVLQLLKCIGHLNICISRIPPKLPATLGHQVKAKLWNWLPQARMLGFRNLPDHLNSFPLNSPPNLELPKTIQTGNDFLRFFCVKMKCHWWV